MIISIILILCMGVISKYLSKAFKLPKLIFYIFTGVVLGPFVFNLVYSKILLKSLEIRQVILIIILMRAGFTIDIKDLKKVGKPAVLLSFLPASFEIIFVTFFTSVFMDLSITEGALLGVVLSAVSPAVVVPRMTDLINNHLGTKKGIPQMILAGSSIDDIYALTLFSSLIELVQGGDLNVYSILKIPITIISSLLIAWSISILFIKIFEKKRDNNLIKVFILIAISYGIMKMEKYVPIYSMLSILLLANNIKTNLPLQSEEMLKVYNKIWIPGELFLFFLLGASVNIKYVFTHGSIVFVLIFFALIFRSIGVFLSLQDTNLNNKEKVFTIISYIPKATVQAAIGGIPLSLGIKSGELILSVSVLAILITAPLGAIGIEYTSKRLLS